MPKYIITYGLKDQNMISEEIHVPFFHEAFDIAQNKALEALDDSGLIIDLKTELFKKMDVFNARIAYMEEAQNHIDFNVMEVGENDSTMYLVSRQSQLFDNNTFKVLSMQEALNFLSKEPELSLDTETTGLDCFKDKLLLIQLGTFDFQIQFDIQSEDGTVPKELKDFMNNYSGTFILQNAKFDLQFLFKQDILLKKVYDTMLVETIITNGLQFGGRDLKTLGEKYCGVELDKSVRGEILFKGLTNRVLEYGANDIKYLSKIKEEQLKRVKEFNLEVAINLDNSFVVVLAYTEYCGIKLDYDKWKRKTDKEIEILNKYKEELERFLYEDGKTQFFNGMVDMFTGTQECIINWNSPKQVVALLEDYGVNCTIYEKQVKKKTANADILSKQKKDFPILEPYLQYKKTQKEIGTYGYNWKDYINPSTSRIHTSYQQLMNTGRLSSKNPNLQNLPSNEATRACFIAEPGNILVDADYSSQEQIILANFSKEENLLNFYARGFTDMHSYIAFLMYPEIRRSTLEELTPEKLKYLKKEYPKQRSIAKSAGFAINYGGDGHTIAENTGISKTEGHFVYDSYLSSFPNLRNYWDLGFKKVVHFGYIQYNNITKRKFFYDDQNYFFKYKDKIKDKLFRYEYPNASSIISKHDKDKEEIKRYSMNYPIQGTAGDMTKYAGILLFKEILKRGWLHIVKIVNFVHDEILVECPKALAKEVEVILVDSMRKAGEPFCKILPINADANISEHWVH